MLVFRARVGDDVQAAFVIGGKVSEDHELAFAEAQGPARLGLGAPPSPEVQADAEDIMGSGIARDVLDAAVKAAREETPSVPSNPTYELLQTFDHPVYLEQALTETAQRLLIMSPSIKNRVVDNVFVGKLRELLRRGVDVYLGYGFSPEQDRKDDDDAVRALARLAAEFSNFRFVRLGDTHAKVLVSDSSFAIFTSFNWLSFVGDPQRVTNVGCSFAGRRSYMKLQPD